MKIFTQEKLLTYRDIAVFTLGLIFATAVIMFALWFRDNYRFQPFIIRRDISPVIETEDIKVVITPSPTQTPLKSKTKTTTALVTAYSCGGLVTDEEIDMNCPSLRNHPNGRTATGTTPIPYKSMACDKANLGRTFFLEGIGEVICTDTGGAINGSGRFDLYVETVQEARQFGKRTLSYYLIK